MYKHTAAVAIAGSLLAVSCSQSDSGRGLTDPSPTTAAPKSQAITVSPSIVSPQIITDASCPGQIGFGVRFTIGVPEGSGSGLTISAVRALFTDTPTMQAPMVTLPAPVPTTQFGSALTQARTPFLLSLGCRGFRAGSIVVIVDTSDGRGQLTSTQVQLTLR